MKKLILISLLSCKTIQTIRNEQYYDNLTNQVTKGQEQSAVAVMRMERIEDRFNTFNSTLEEMQHNIEIASKSNSDTVNDLLPKISSLTKDVEALKKDMQEMQKAIVELSKKKAEPEGEAPTYANAVKNYRASKYKISESQFRYILDNKKVKGDELAHTYHNLGMITYMNKKYSEAITLFSKLYTTFPKTAYVPNGLLYLAKSFLDSKPSKSNEAIATLKQLIEKYPDAKQIPEAKKLLDRVETKT